METNQTKGLTKRLKAATAQRFLSGVALAILGATLLCFNYLCYVIFINSPFYLATETFRSRILFPLAIFSIGLGMAAYRLKVSYRDRDLKWEFLFVFVLLLAFASTSVAAMFDQPLFLIVALFFVGGMWIIRWLRVPPRYREALNYFNNANYEKALEVVNLSIQSRPRTDSLYYLRAMTHRELGETRAAEADAKTAIELAPKDYLNHFALGFILFQDARYQEAKLTFEKALQIAPNNAMTKSTLGRVCYRLGDYQKGLDLLADAVQHKMPNASFTLLAHYYLGRSAEILGQQGKADAAYKSLPKFRNGFNEIMNRPKSRVETPEILAFRADLEDIERKLNEFSK